MQEVQNVAVGVEEKHRSIAFYLLHIREKTHPLLDQVGVNAGEIGDRKRQVPQPRRLHPGGRLRLRRRLDDFDHRPVRRFNETRLAARALVVDDEPQVIHIPLGQSVRIERRDRGVFNSGDHIPEL